MTVLTRDAWSDAEAAAALGEAFRATALGGGDLRSLAQELDLLRAERARADALAFWNVLDDAVGRAHGRPTEMAALIALRAGFVARLASHCRRRFTDQADQDAAAAEGALIELLARTVAQWRFELSQELAPLMATLFPGHGQQALIRDGEEAAREQRWLAALPFYQALGDRRDLEPRTRAALYVVAAMIWQFQLSRPRRVLELLAQAHELAPEDEFVLSVEAEMLARQYQVDQGMRLCQQVLARNPECGEALVALGVCAQMRGDPLSAEDALRKATRVRPGLSLAYHRLIELSGEPGARPELTGELADLTSRIAEVAPLEACDGYVAAATVVERRAPDQAEEWYRLALAVNPDCGSALLGLAELTTATPEVKGRARQVLERALARQPTDPGTFWQTVRLIEVADVPAAIALCQRAEGTGPDHAARFRAKRARLAWDLGTVAGKPPEGPPREAVFATLLSAVALSPDDEYILREAETIADLVADGGALEHATELSRRIAGAAGPSYQPRLRHQLGKLALTAKQYPIADEHFAAAIASDPGCALFHANRARGLRLAQRWGRADELWAAAPVSVQCEPSFRTDLALLYNAEANDLYEKGHPDKSVRLYKRATELMPQDAMLYMNLAGAYERDRSRPADGGELALAALRTALAVSQDPEPVRKRIRQLQNRRLLSDVFGEQGTKLPTVIPVVLEVASNLIPHVAGADDQLSQPFSQAIEELRAAIASNYGVRLPGIRVRGREDFAPGAFTVRLSDVPVASGSLDPDRVLLLAPVALAQKDGLDAEEAVDPLTRLDASWLPSPSASAAGATGREVLRAPAVLTRHLQAVVEHNLADLVGHEETHALLEERAPGLLPEVMKTRGCLTGLTSVLRALLNERTPISELETITRTFLEGCRAGAGPVQIVEAVRSLPPIRRRLYGNEPTVPVLLAGKDLEDALAGALIETDAPPTLAMAPELCQEALSAVRNEMPWGAPKATLIVARSAVRPFARRLLELEFPDLAVLTRDELLRSLPANPTVVTLEGSS